MTRIDTKDAPAAIGPYSQAHTHGDLIITSGQLPINPLTQAMPESAEAQTRQSLTNVLAIVRAAGGDATTVLKTTCFLVDMDDFAAFNSVYTEFFPGEAPARSCIAVRALPLGARVEVEAIARTAKSEPVL